MKRKLIIDEWISLDGFVSDASGGLGFFAGYVRELYKMPQEYEFLHSVDTILLGRKSYDQFSALWPERPVENELLAEKMNTLDKVVFSAALKQAPWGNWRQCIVETDPIEKVKALKSMDGKDMVVWASITLAQALMKSELVDQYRLHICPVITGGGRRMFGEPILPSKLTLKNTYETHGVVSLCYDVITAQTININ